MILTDTSPKKAYESGIQAREKMLKSVVTREMQIKTTMRNHYTPIRMVKIKETDLTECWQGCGATGTHICWQEWKM